MLGESMNLTVEQIELLITLAQEIKGWLLLIWLTICFVSIFALTQLNAIAGKKDITLPKMERDEKDSPPEIKL